MDFSIEGFDAFAEQLDAQIAAGGAAVHGPCVATTFPSAFGRPANPSQAIWSWIRHEGNAYCPLAGGTGGDPTSFFPRLATVMLRLLAPLGKGS